MCAIGYDLIAGLAREAPRVARHDPARRQTAVAHGEHVVGSLGIEDGIGHVVAVPDVQRARGVIHGPIGPHQPFQRRATRTGSHGHVKAQQPLPHGHVVLPADPDHGEAEAHQQPVAEVLGLGRIQRPLTAVEVGERRLSTAVAHLEQGHAAAGGRALRSQHHKVRPGFDEPVGVARGRVEVDDPGVGGVARIEDEVDFAHDLLVGPSRAEGPAAEHIFTPLDLDAYDLAGRKCRADQQRETERKERKPPSHPGLLDNRGRQQDRIERGLGQTPCTLG